jgi:hypothetical protein
MINYIYVLEKQLETNIKELIAFCQTVKPTARDPYPWLGTAWTTYNIHVTNVKSRMGEIGRYSWNVLQMIWDYYIKAFQLYPPPTKANGKAG